MSRTGVIAAWALALATIAMLPAPDQTTARAAAAANDRSALPAAARRGLAFAQQRCAGCHAVSENQTSPNPEAPQFEDIANRPGVTSDTLQQFLRDSHNYPAAMNFDVESHRIRDLANYIETMKKPDYRPLM